MIMAAVTHAALVWDSLGMIVGKKTLKAKKVDANGLILDWNDSCPHDAVCIGDRILSVNGKEAPLYSLRVRDRKSEDLADSELQHLLSQEFLKELMTAWCLKIVVEDTGAMVTFGYYQNIVCPDPTWEAEWTNSEWDCESESKRKLGKFNASKIASIDKVTGPDTHGRMHKS